MRRKELLIVVLLIAALLPYFIVCFYALPFADDFCYGWTSAEKISFIQRFMRQYLNWSGRYSAHVLLCNHPLISGYLFCYRAAVFASLLAVLGAVLLLIHRVLGNFLIAAISTLTALLFYLCYIPQLTEGVYWYTGVCNYLLGNVCFVLHLALFMLWYGSKGTVKPLYFFIATIPLVASIGFNEVGAAVIPAYYLLAVIVQYRNRATSVNENAAFRATFIFFGIAAISSAFVVFSPGNFVRSHQFHSQFNFLHSVLYASLQTARFTANWLGTIPALALSFLALAKADKLPDTPLLRLNYWLILLLISFTVFMSAFIPYYGTGILGQHRTINYAFLFCILLWLWFLISLSKQYGLPEKLTPHLSVNGRLAIVVACILCMVFTDNGYKILCDFRSNNFVHYKQEFMARQENILQHPEMEIPPLKNIPQSFTIVDARGDSTWWVNKCMKYFYMDTKIELK